MLDTRLRARGMTDRLLQDIDTERRFLDVVSTTSEIEYIQEKAHTVGRML